MFFLVHYGDADVLVLNSDCQIKILLERIKKVSVCKANDVIDLTDMQAVVQKLTDLPDESYASKVINPRGNYVLVRVKSREDDNGAKCKQYIPLLQGLETINPEYLNRLSNRKVNPDAYSSNEKGGMKSNHSTAKEGRKRNESRVGQTASKARKSSTRPSYND